MNTALLFDYFKKSSGVSTDSRSISDGQMFFALCGENSNGNKFASDAIKRGAICAVIDDPDYENEKTILVDDCLAELQALAACYRKSLNIPVLAVTGTNGKTTTKELLSVVLSVRFKVHGTKGNLNNHIGVPLTILSAPPDTAMLIIEMGASHRGEIQALCKIADPGYGIITNIGTAHIEGFGSAEGVLKTKSELYEYLYKVNGIAIYNDNDRVLSDQVFKIVNKAIPYSFPAGTLLKVDAEPSEPELKVSAVYKNSSYSICTHLFGIYNIENVRAAIATGLLFGIRIDEVLYAIENYQPGNNRSQIKRTANNTLICDSYNANPSSMQNAIDAFAVMRAGDKACILGDMLELGEKSEEEHIKILDLLRAGNIREVFLVGLLFSKVSASYGFRSFPDVNSLKEFLVSNPLKGYHILIKGSRGITLEKVYDQL